MKKIFLAISLIVLAVVFGSCNKNEPLDSTTWLGVFEDDHLAQRITIKFTENQASVEISIIDKYDGAGSFETQKGTYTYDKENVCINLKEDENYNFDMGKTWTGTVDKEKMTLDIKLINWFSIGQVVFTKQ